ncbi:hypothetical protein F4775DRAFT_266537 [Biscogniauxia sp. FL1348]|nr:hypothetical protein F4775DRAFT_266537 [Biscogniauxia sp. FL1348]
MSAGLVTGPRWNWPEMTMLVLFFASSSFICWREVTVGSGKHVFDGEKASLVAAAATGKRPRLGRRKTNCFYTTAKRAVVVFHAWPSLCCRSVDGSMEGRAISYD